MKDYSEIKRYIEDRLARGLDAPELDGKDVMALIAENERQAAKIEQVRSRSVSLDCSPDGVIPNALDAWGRAVPQHLPYDFSGNTGTSATQYCNGWNDAGGYWKAHCVDIQAERDQLKAENEVARMRIKELDLLFGRYILAMRSAVIEEEHGKGPAAAMEWIYNSLVGPGQLPPEGETDSQAYFDREIVAVDNGMQEVLAFHDQRRAKKEAGGNV